MPRNITVKFANGDKEPKNFQSGKKTSHMQRSGIKMKSDFSTGRLRARR